MISAAQKDKLLTFLANGSILAGLGLVVHASLSNITPMLPIHTLTLADFLIAAGMIPHFSLHLTV